MSEDKDDIRIDAPIAIPPFIAVLFWGTVLFMLGLAYFLGWVLMRFIDSL